MRYLEFLEEHPTQGYIKVKRTEEDAIEYQREYALKTHNYVYPYDQQALDDYICVNWAYYVEEL